MPLGAATGEINILVDQAIRNLGRLKGELSSVDQAGGASLAQTDDRMQKVSAGMDVLAGSALVMGGAITGGFAVGMKSAMGFEAQMSGIGAVTGATAEEMEQLRSTALRLGADTSTSASQAALGIEELAKSGLPIPDIMNGAADSMVSLAEAGGLQVPAAASIMAAAMGQFNIAASESSRVADALAGAANASRADVSDLGAGLAQVGGIAGSFGYTLEETTAALAAMANAGVTGSDAATSLKSAMLQMAAPSTTAKAAMDQWGFSLANADGTMKSLDQTVEELAATTANMTEKQRIDFLTAIAGSDGYRALDATINAYNGTVQNQAAAQAGATNAWEEYLWATSGGISAADVAKERMNNLSGSFEELKGTLETVAITFFSRITPAVRVAVDAVAGLLRMVLSLPGPVQTALAALTGIAGAFLLMGGGAILLYPKLKTVSVALQALTRTGTIVSALKAVRVAMMGALGPVALIVAAGAALYLAYRSNFLGFADGVNAVFGKIKDVLNAVAGPIMAFVNQFRDMGKATEQETQKVTKAIDGMVETVNYEDGTTAWFYTELDDNGVPQRMGKIVESHANADGTTAEVLIKGDDGEYWATIDLATGKIVGEATVKVQADAGPMYSMIDRIQGGLLAMQAALNAMGITAFDPIIGGAIRLLESVENVARGIDDFTGGFRKMWDSLGGNEASDVMKTINRIGGIAGKTGKSINGLSRFLKSLSAGLRAINGESTPAFLEKIADGLDTLADIVQTAVEIFRRFRSEGLDPLAAVFATLSTFVPQLGGYFGRLEAQLRAGWAALRDLVSMAGNLLQALGNLLTGDWGGALRNLKEAAEDGLSALRNMGEFLLNGLMQIPELLMAAFKAVDWGAVLEGLQRVATAIPGVLGDLSDALLGWTQRAADSIDWGAIITGAADLAGKAVGLAGDLLGAVAGWIAEAVPGAETWRTLLNNAMDIVSELSGKLGDLAAWAGRWIADAVPGLDTWRSLLANAGDIVTGLSGKLGDLAGWVGRWILDAVPGADTWRNLLGNAADIVTGLSSRLGNLAAWVGRWIGDAVPGIDAWRSLLSQAGDIITGLSSRLGDLVAWVITWIADAVPGIETWKKIIGNVPNVAGEIVTAFGDLATAISGWATDAFGGLVSAVDGVLSKIQGAIDKAKELIGLGDSPAFNDDGSANQWTPDGVVTLPAQTAPPPPPTSAAEVAAITAAMNQLYIQTAAVKAQFDLFGTSLNTANTALTTLTTSVTDLDTKLGAVKTTVGDLNTGFVTFVTDSIGQMGGWKSGVEQIVRDTMATMRSQISSGTSTSKQSVLTFVRDTIAVMGGWKQGIEANVRNTTTTVRTNIDTGFRNATASVRQRTLDMKTLMNSFANDLKSKATTAGDNVHTSMLPGLQSATTAVRTHGDTWVSTLRGFGSDMYSAGRYIGLMAGDGIVSGLDARQWDVSAAAGRIIATVDSAMRYAARIASPSGMTEEIGGYLIAGMVNGLHSGERAIRSAAENLITTLRRALDQPITIPVEQLARQLENVTWPGRAFWDTLSGPKQQSRSGSWNLTAGNYGELKRVIELNMTDVVQQGEWGGDTLTHIPAAIRDAVRQIGQRLAGVMDSNWNDVSTAEAAAYQRAVDEALALSGRAGMRAPAPVTADTLAAAFQRVMATAAPRRPSVAAMAPVTGDGGVTAALRSVAAAIPATELARSTAPSVTMENTIVLEGTEDPNRVADQLIGILQSVSMQQRAAHAVTGIRG